MVAYGEDATYNLNAGPASPWSIYVSTGTPPSAWGISATDLLVLPPNLLRIPVLLRLHGHSLDLPLTTH